MRRVGDRAGRTSAPSASSRRSWTRPRRRRCCCRCRCCRRRPRPRRRRRRRRPIAVAVAVPIAVAVAVPIAVAVVRPLLGHRSQRARHRGRQRANVRQVVARDPPRPLGAPVAAAARDAAPRARVPHPPVRVGAKVHDDDVRAHRAVPRGLDGAARQDERASRVRPARRRRRPVRGDERDERFDALGSDARRRAVEHRDERRGRFIRSHRRPQAPNEALHAARALARSGPTDERHERVEVTTPRNFAWVFRLAVSETISETGPQADAARARPVRGRDHPVRRLEPEERPPAVARGLGPGPVPVRSSAAPARSLGAAPRRVLPEIAARLPAQGRHQG